MDGGDLPSSTGRRRIGLREVRALGAGETIWDSVVIGFGARRQRSDAVSYVLFYRTLTGRKRLLTIGRHASPWLPDEARQEARRLLGVVAAGGDPMLDREIRRPVIYHRSQCHSLGSADLFGGLRSFLF